MPSSGTASFNPCRVFLVVATIPMMNAFPSAYLFQSLSGFLGRCDFGQQFAARMENEGFQSLSGFLGRCDPSFSNSSSRLRPCFNPCRVFLVVATRISRLPACPPPGFQSLSGFLGRCDGAVMIGSAASSAGFNPCRVFLVVATLSLFCISCQQYCFNPCRVFLVVATYGRKGQPESSQKCFNPCRVFLVVATWRIWQGHQGSLKFQSLSGFLGRCDGGSKLVLLP